MRCNIVGGVVSKLQNRFRCVAVVEYGCLLRGDWVDLAEGCVEIGEEGSVVELKKASVF